MSMRLRGSNVDFPSGGFAFTDPLTNKRFDDPGSDLNARIRQVIEHRRGNPTIYPNAGSLNPKTVESEILIQVCAANPHICEDSEWPVMSQQQSESQSRTVVQENGKVCLRCGSVDFELIKCVSCGGRRVGLKCIKCGLETP